jgi:hypothetical protein
MRQINFSRRPNCASKPGGCQPGNNLSNINTPPSNYKTYNTPAPDPQPIEYIPEPPPPAPPVEYIPEPPIYIPEPLYIPSGVPNEPPMYEEPEPPAPRVKYIPEPPKNILTRELGSRELTGPKPPKSLRKRLWSGIKGFGKRTTSAVDNFGGFAGNVVSDSFLDLAGWGMGGRRNTRRNNRRNTRRNNRRNSRRNNRKGTRRN